MCVLQNSQTYGGVGNSVCYEWQELTRWCDLIGGRQAPEHLCVKHEITSYRKESGEVRSSPEKWEKFKLEIVQFSANN